MSIRVIIADDHTLVQEALKELLSTADDIVVTDLAKTGKEAYALVKNTKVDLVLMDINMPEVDGAEATKMIKAEFSHVKVIALTMEAEAESVKKMLGAGVDGYLLKSCTSEELNRAIRQVMEGGEYYCKNVLHTVMRIFKNPKEKEQAPLAELTKREKEVLKLIIDQATNKEIADTLYISTKTVEVHKHNLLEKTGSTNVVGLVLYAIRNKWID